MSQRWSFDVLRVPEEEDGNVYDNPIERSRAKPGLCNIFEFKHEVLPELNYKVVIEARDVCRVRVAQLPTDGLPFFADDIVFLR